MPHMQQFISNCIVQIIQQNPVVKNIFVKIHEEGGKVLLVGGIVRDCLSQKAGCDLDFEVYHLSFDRLQKILSLFGPVSFVGKSFGVLRLHTLDADWSIPRKDSFGRKPIVELDPNMSFIDAFKRRDLTINAMGIDVHTGELIDPYDGLQDLQNKVLRAPDVLFFVQDPLRLFRVMQFIARLHMKPDIALNNVCKTMDISTISAERIDQEFKKLFLKSDQPLLGIAWLQEIGRFKEIFPDLDFDKLCKIHFNVMLNSSSLLLSAMWALMSCALKNVYWPQACNQPATKYNLVLCKNFIKKYVRSVDIVDHGSLIAWYVHYIPYLKESSDYKWLAHWISKVCSLEQLGLVGRCLFHDDVITNFVTQAQNAHVYQQAIQPLLHGADLIHLAQGKELGELVKRAYEIQLNQNINDKHILMELVKQ